jgi:hypothetical protein
MAFDGPAMADAVEAVIKAALGPVMARLRLLEAELQGSGLPALGGRLTALEDRSAVPGPVGPAGPAGPAGADGLGFDEYRVEYDGERTFKHVWQRGDRREERAFSLPVVIYRGVFVSGRLYEPGDMVTVNGSVFHCNTASLRVPGDGSADWTLAVKRGKDDRERGR